MSLLPPKDEPAKSRWHITLVDEKGNHRQGRVVSATRRVIIARVDGRELRFARNTGIEYDGDWRIDDQDAAWLRAGSALAMTDTI